LQELHLQAHSKKRSTSLFFSKSQQKNRATVSTEEITSDMASLFSKMTLRTVGAGAAVLNFMSLDHTVSERVPQKMDIEVRVSMNIPSKAEFSPPIPMESGDDLMQIVGFKSMLEDSLESALYSNGLKAWEVSDPTIIAATRIEIVSSPRVLSGRRLIADHLQEMTLAIKYVVETPDEASASSIQRAMRSDAERFRSVLLSLMNNEIQNQSFLAVNEFAAVSVPADGVHSSYTAVSIPYDEKYAEDKAKELVPVPQNMHIQARVSMNIPSKAEFSPPIPMESGDDLMQIMEFKGMLEESLRDALHRQGAAVRLAPVIYTVTRIDIVSSRRGLSKHDWMEEKSLAITYSLETPDEATALSAQRAVTSDVGGFCYALMISIDQGVQNYSFLAVNEFAAVSVPSDGIDCSYAAVSAPSDDNSAPNDAAKDAEKEGADNLEEGADNLKEGADNLKDEAEKAADKAVEDVMDWAGGRLDDAVEDALDETKNYNYSAHRVEEEESNVGVLIAIIAGGVVVLGLIIVGLCCACAAGQKGTNHVAGAGLSTTTASASTAPVVQVNMAIPPPQQVQMESVV
jgi:hypothetical protein